MLHDMDDVLITIYVMMTLVWVYINQLVPY